MIETLEGLPDGCIGIRAIGQFSVNDFQASIAPEVDAVTERHDQLRLVLELGDEFDGFGEGAWGDLTDELRHIHFHRGVVITDDGHISNAINILKWTLRGHVRTFHVREFDDAVRWAAG